MNCFHAYMDYLTTLEAQGQPDAFLDFCARAAAMPIWRRPDHAGGPAKSETEERFLSEQESGRP